MTAPPERPALGYANRVDGIDVSSFQPSVAYEQVAGAGFRFAVVRASLGISYTDPKAAEHLHGFRAAGMHAIPYAAARPSEGGPRLQARRLFDSMGDVYPGRLVLDLEARNGLLNSQIVDFAEEFLEECETFGEREPVLYSFPDFLRRLGADLTGSKLGRCPLWLASFPYEPWVPDPGYSPGAPMPWARVAMHQYSGNLGFRVPGVVGACDRDLFLGSESEFRAWLGLPPSDAA